MSINYKHAERTGFGQLRDMVDNIPYFESEFTRDKKVDSILKFPGKLAVLPGTDNLSVVSTNLFGCTMDEADFYRRGASANPGDARKASQIYRDITDRRISRFMINGYDPGFSAIISSATYQSSFVSQRIRKAIQTKSVTAICSLWDAKPHNYSQERFFVFNGTERQDAFVATSVDSIADVAPDEIKQKIRTEAISSDLVGENLIRDIMSKLPKRFVDNFTSVPMDFKPRFLEDTYGALQNLAGVAVVVSGKLFSSKTTWKMNINNEIKHPFTRAEFPITLRGPEQVIDYFVVDSLFKEISPGKWKLRRSPNAKRFVHIDQSLTKDSAGIAIAHIEKFIVDPNTLLKTPVVEIDLMIRILAPKKPEEISIAKCRKFIFDLERLGMRFGKVTYDSYQSRDAIQIFLTHKINAGLQSVDRDDTQYLQFIDLLNETRISMYEYILFEKEFFNLDHDVEKKKVDHPEFSENGEPGKKDISDAVVGAVNNAVEDKDSFDSVNIKELSESIVFSFEKEHDKRKDDNWVYASYTKNLGAKRVIKLIGEDDAFKNI